MHRVRAPCAPHEQSWSFACAPRSQFRAHRVLNRVRTACAPREEQVDKMFSEMDLNRDKRISLYEFKTAG